MRILLNGVYKGNNCPPFFLQLKKMKHDVKIVDALYFNKPYRDFSELLSENDFVLPKYGFLDFINFKIYQKTGLSFFLFSIRKELCKIIDWFRPDIIINHQISIRTNLFLATGFYPQVGYVYGSEIHNNAKSKFLFESFHLLNQIFVTTDHMKSLLLQRFNFLKQKTQVIPIGILDYDFIISKSHQDKSELRQTYGIEKTKFIIYDDRSCRDTNVIDALMQTIILYKKQFEKYDIAFLILKGNGGDDKTMLKIKNICEENNCSQIVYLINEVVSNNVLYDLLILSDAIISLLPYDQFGTIILNSALLNKTLFLYDLPQYKQQFGNHAYYFKSLKADEIFSRIIEGRDTNNESKAIHNLKVALDFLPNKFFNKLLKELNNQINTIKHVSDGSA